MLNSGITEFRGMRVYVDPYMNEDTIVYGTPPSQKDIATKLNEAANVYANAQRRGAGNFVIVSQKVADILDELNRDIPKEKRAALRKKLNKIMQKYWQKKNSNALYTLLYAVRDKYRQLFISIDIEEAKERGFKFARNVYGDEINHLNCRSIWVDKKNRAWCVEQLNT